MANEYSADIPKGFNVPKQVRLDSITGIQNEETLKNLGSGNILAFKYYEGLKIYCKDEKTEYIWREVVGPEIGLLDTAFTYPTYTAVDGINYSGKSFNFFEVINNIEPADGSETKLIEGTNVTIIGTGTTLDPYEISSSFETSQTYIQEGDNVIITGTGIISDPYIINTDLTDLGIVKTIDNEVIAPAQSLSIINNELTGKILVTKEYVESVIPSNPDGSETKLNPGDNVTILGTGTTLDPYIINSITEESLTYINPGDDIEVLGIGTIDNPYIINSTVDSKIVNVIVEGDTTHAPSGDTVFNALELKSYLSTGLIKNGLISINIDPTKYDVSAGVGIITNYDNPEVPVTTVVNFDAVVGHTPTYLTSSNITYIAINSSGMIVESALQFTAEQRRDLIILGAVIHSNLTNINLVNNISAPTNAGINQLHDFMEVIGALNVSGNKYSANGANLSLNKSAGEIFKLGVNFANDWKHPHDLDLTGQTALTFRYRKQDGIEYTDTTVINPTIWDNAGVLETVPANKFTIQTVTLFQTNQTRIQPGQNIYNTMAEAEAAILTRSYVVESNIAMNGITRAYIILKNTATSLQNASDTKIIEAQKFGGVASGGVALTDAAIIAALGYTPENVANKQNSLAVDGGGIKYPTVDAVNTLKWIKSNESLSLAQRKGDVLYGILDQYTGEEMTLSKVTGTPTVDNVIYFQLGAEYFKRDFNNVNSEWWGAVGDGTTDDTVAIQAMLDAVGYFVLKNKTYKITASLEIPNDSNSFDKISHGVDFSQSILNCVGMAGLPAIKLETSSQLVRHSFKDFGIIGDSENAINLTTSTNVFNSVFENLNLISTGDCLVLTNDFSCKFTSVQVSSTNGHGFNVSALASNYFNNCYAHFVGAAKAGYRIKGLAILNGCNGIDGGGIWGWFGANVADDGLNTVANISLIGCNVEDYDTRGIYCSFQSSLYINGTYFVAKLAGTYADDINFANVSNSLVLENVFYVSKGSTRTASSHIVSAQQIGFVKSNSSAFQDYYRTDAGLVYKIPYETFISSEFGIDSYKIPYFTTDRNYGFNLQVPRTWTLNTANFSVTGETKIKTGNTIATAFDSATGGVEGQELYILIKDNFTTINHMNAGAGRFKMTSGLNKICADGQVYHFLYDGTQWVEQSANDLPLKANLASPTFTGSPTAPTATVGTNTTQIATTAFVQNATNSILSSDNTFTANNIFQDIVNFNSIAILNNYTVATLPTGLIEGAIAYVTDGLTPTYRGTATGGGSEKCLVFYDGTIWRF